MQNLPSASMVYPACVHIKRNHPEMHVDEETLKSFSIGSRILPLFEKRIFDHTHMKHYSLKTNDSLRCSWKEFLRQLEERQRTPFQFPNANDFHFYKHNTRYEPAQSLANRAQLKQLSFSQVGDTRGYAPVPDDIHHRRTAMNIRKPRPRTAKIKQRVVKRKPIAVTK